LNRRSPHAAIALLHELPRSAGDAVLLCTDLNAENVLAADREPWLAIDPKPFIGDPAYDTIQHMLNCRSAHGPRADLPHQDAQRLTQTRRHTR
jgi:streptomycin 6-kinase